VTDLADVIPGLGSALERLTAESVLSRSAGRYAEALSDVRECHDLLHDVPDAALEPLRPSLVPLRLEWALTLALAGRSVESLRGYERTHAEAVLYGQRTIAASAAGSAGIVHALGGDLRNADEWIVESLRISGESEPAMSTRLAQALVGLARADEAAVESALADGEFLESAPSWAIHSFAEGLQAVAKGSPQAGLARLNSSVRAHFPRTWSSGMNAWLTCAARAYLYLAVGDVDGARTVFETAHGSTDELGGELIASALAWTRLRDGDPRRASSLASSYIDGGRGLIGTTINMALVAAIANLDLGNDEIAGELFRSAFDLAEPDGHLAPFLRATPEERSRLAALAGVSLAHPTLDLLNAPVTSMPSRARPRLTGREKVVLRHIVDGRTNDEIAVLEHVTKNTVKSQASALFRKLGVSSRSDAIDAATRVPGLLS
jgi:DNA-binding CsgD family transcriptional regulator